MNLQGSLQQIGSQHLLWTGALRASREAFPAIDLLSFTESSANLTIVAQASNTPQAVALATYLETAGLFSATTIPSLTRDTQSKGGKGTKFNIVGSKGGL